MHSQASHSNSRSKPSKIIAMLRPTTLRPIARFRSLAIAPMVLAAGVLVAGCGDDSSETPTEPTSPVSVVETFSDTLNINGARTHTFVAQRAGTVSAVLVTLAPDDTATVGLSIGTWNGSACQTVIANDNATLAGNKSVLGSATGTGAFCVRLYDVGRLTQAIDYSVSVEHF